jgi:hypothetical protein
MKTLLVLTLLVMTAKSFASIICHTPRMNKIFEINDNKVSFIHEGDRSSDRAIASLISRNKNDAKGITKIVDFEGAKHTIHIEDAKRFSDVEDYILIKSKTGHEIIYPITCNLK